MIFKMLADHNHPQSLAARGRKKRFAFFLSLLSQLESPITILDVGGTEQYWHWMGIDNLEGIHITVLNVNDCVASSPNIRCVKGDARNLDFPDKTFDVVYSNSVIEHVGGYKEQQKMAQEVKRVGKRYFIQTPNKQFFIEPHYLFPFFQYLPMKIQVWMVMNFNLGWFKKQPSMKQAQKLVESISLLKRDEFLSLFPGCNLYEEKLLGMKKAFIVYSGWN